MGVIVTLIAVVFVIAIALLIVVRSSAQLRLNVSCWWQDTVEPLFRPERELDPLKLQKEILRVAVPASTVLSVSGELRVVPKVTIELSDRDWSVLQSSPLGFDQIVSDMEGELTRRLDSKALAGPRPIRLALAMAPWARLGRPRVSLALATGAAAGAAMSGERPRSSGSPDRGVTSASGAAGVLGSDGVKSSVSERARAIGKREAAVRSESQPRSRSVSEAVASLPRTAVMPPDMAPDAIRPARVGGSAPIAATRVAEPIPKTRQAPPLSPADLARPVVAIRSTELVDDARLIPANGEGRPIDFAAEGHVNQGGRRHWTVGRNSDVVVNHPEVSSAHAQFTLAAGVWLVRDLESTNGTYLNGNQVADSELISGDEIRLGLTGPSYVLEIKRFVE